VRLAYVVLPVVLVATLSGCSALSHPASPAAGQRHTPLPVRGKRAVPLEAQAKLLPDARAQISHWAHELAPIGGSRTTEGVDVRLPSPDPSMRVLPDVVDSRTPVFEQLSLAAPDWWDGRATVDVVDSKGAVVGWMLLLWTKGAWKLDATGMQEASERMRQEGDQLQARAETAMSRVLGGSLEETVTICKCKYGEWELGRRGSREAGVLLELPAQDLGTNVPRTGHVYTGANLARWLNWPQRSPAQRKSTPTTEAASSQK
jgi:hypothetical protein